MIMQKEFDLEGRHTSLIIKQDTDHGCYCSMCQKTIKHNPVVFANTCCHTPISLCMACFLKVIREFNIDFQNVTKKNDGHSDD